MFGKSQDIYRTKALERLSSPEAVDQLLHVTGPRDWLPLMATGLLLAVVVTWSLSGSIPTTVSARGVLVHPRTVVEAQSLSAGRLESLEIKSGDYVNKGDVIGHLDQLDLRRRMEEDQRILRELEQQDTLKGSLQDQQVRLHRLQNDTERNYMQLQSDTLRKNIQDAEAIAPMLKKRLEGYQELLKQGLISPVSADLLNSQQAVLDNETKVIDARARLKQIEAQLRETEAREADTNRETVEGATSRKNQIQELQGRISLARLQLDRSGEIRSEYSGKIIEMTAAAGQILTSGSRIARIEVTENTQMLVSMSYMPVGDGKRIQPGMEVQIIPDTVERQQYGGVVGIVESVSDLPVTKEAAQLVVGNPAIVDALLSNGPFIQVVSRMEPDVGSPSGYKWSSSEGPEGRLSAGLTTTARVTIERRTPITYIFPFLRSLSGIY